MSFRKHYLPGRVEAAFWLYPDSSYKGYVYLPFWKQTS